jgi:hypothetical protein
MGAFGLARAAQASSPHACQIQAVIFEGWKAQQVSNRWVRLTIVPQLGGRLMQVAFGDHSYLFVNTKLKGKYFLPVEGTTPTQWHNYGGDKIWPLPEGEQDEQHWPGPVSDALDAGNYEFKVLAQGAVCTVRLDGPADPRTGLQYSREISLGSESPEISFHAVMKNASAHPIRWSMQTVTQYSTASTESADSYNRNFWAFTPINPRSAYDDGYHARLGPSNDPAYSVKDGLFALHWLYFEREVWLDSTDSWVAVVDGSTRYAMVERFAHMPAEYPGKATVIFYTNGPAVEFDDKGMPFLSSSNPEEMPFYMEAELNSPMVSLAPGETYAFDTKWFPTRAVADLKTVIDAGVVNRPLAATVNGKSILLTGSFGVFFPGNLVAYVFDARGVRTAAVTIQAAGPLDLVNVQREISRSPTAVRVSLHLIDEQGMDRGSLGESTISKAEHDP